MRKFNCLGSLVACLALLFVSFSARAENWPHWRGAAFNGSSPETKLPEAFSKTENVLWSVELPGSSAATPIIWGEHVFVSTVDKANQGLVALCYDRGSGQLVWSNEVSGGPISRDGQSNFAGSSPVTDGKLVVFFYANGELAAYDFAGKKAWQRNIQKDYGTFAFLWTFSASPTIYDNKLYLQVLQRNTPVQGRGRVGGPNDSYLLALDPGTGKQLWKHIRPSEAREESLEAYSTPIPFTAKGRTELLIAGGDCITGHDPKTGEELWRWGTWNPSRIGHWRLVPSPVAGDNIVLACAPKGAPVFAFKAGLKGNQDDSALAWKSQDRKVTSDVATPLLYKNRFYVLNSEGTQRLSCLEPGTGKVLWTGDLQSRSKIEASPTGADDKIYCMNFNGDVFVVGAGDTFKLLHKAEMGVQRNTLQDAVDDRRVRSSISVSQGCLFIRTDTKLYCVGAKAK